MALAAGSIVLAERYARALLEVAIDKKIDAERVLEQIEAFARLVDDHPKLAEVLSSPAISEEKRCAVLEQILEQAGGVEACTSNLLRLLVIRERIPLLTTVVDQYQRLLLEHRNVQPGTVTSALPLTEDQKTRLEDSLGKALGKTMELGFDTDRELVGGIVVRVGNRIFDASVLTQLARFREKALSSF